MRSFNAVMPLTRSHCERGRSTGAMARYRGHRRGWRRGSLAGGARAHQERKLVIGGKRHLALADGLPCGELKAWRSPIAESILAILAHRGEPVAVLASGD